MLAALDEYVDATSPKRGRVISLEGERVPVGGVSLVKSGIAPALWDRIGEAIRERAGPGFRGRVWARVPLIA